jgi:phospholipase B1
MQSVTLIFLLSSVLAVADISSCPKLPARSSPPRSVQDLRPDDIKVIGALGDSITAGFAAKGLANPNGNLGLGDLKEDRGVSFVIGGDARASSVGNYLAYYNPSLVGRSVGTRNFNLFGGNNPSVDKFNAAITGAVSKDIL